MDADPHDEFGFPLSLSEQFRGRTTCFTPIHPQSSATQEEDWYEEPVPRHRNESTAASLAGPHHASPGQDVDGLSRQVTPAFTAAVDTTGYNESTTADVRQSAPSGRIELQVTAASLAAVDTRYILTPYEERDGSISYRYAGVDE